MTYLPYEQLNDEVKSLAIDNMYDYLKSHVPTLIRYAQQQDLEYTSPYAFDYTEDNGWAWYDFVIDHMYDNIDKNRGWIIEQMNEFNLKFDDECGWVC